MAIYHLHAQIISRGNGQSAVAASAYRSGEKLYNENNGTTHNCRDIIGKSAYNSGENLANKQGKLYDYTRKRGVVHTEIILPENAPQEFQDRSTLWNAVEKSEKRKDSQLARELDIALPIEFDRAEQIEIIREYINENFVDKGMCADFAIHDKQDGNPHAHIMLTTRNVEKNGFKGKNRDWNKTELLEQWRENWQNICNEKLQEKGIDERIDHRTLEEQGIDREPTIHEGRNPERIKENKEIIARNKAKSPEKTAEYMHELKECYIILDKEVKEVRQKTVNAQQSIRQQLNNFKKPQENSELEQIISERDTFALEYQRQKLLAEISPNGLKIKEELEKLNQENRPKNIDDRIFQSSSERMLDLMTEEKFMNTLERVRPEQAEKLVKMRELEKVKQHIRGR